MKESVKTLQGRYFRKKFFVTLGWTVFWYALCYALIEFFYGPGLAFADGHPYWMGVIFGTGFVGFCICTAYFFVRLTALLRCKKRIRRSMESYLPDGELSDPFETLDRDLRGPALGTEIYIGCDWLLFPGRAMNRDAIAGVFYEELFKSYLSRKVRLTVVDDRGESMYLDIPKAFHPTVYHWLIEIHPNASNGQHQALINWINNQAKNAGEQGVDYKRLKSASSGPVSRWDRSPVLEDNHIACQYEQWLLAAYSTYLMGDRFFDSDFSYAGGYERTAYQQQVVLNTLDSAWDLRHKGELLRTVSSLVGRGRKRPQTPPDGWHLGRAVMLLGYGYISGLLTRGEMVRYSLDAAYAIQQSFSSWKELLDSHMIGFMAWAKDPKNIAFRRRRYRELLEDPSSVVNTVPFQANLPELYREAAARLGITDYYDEDEFDGDDLEEEET